MNARANGEREFDRLMTAWFEADAQVREPDDLIDEVLAQTQRTRRRPGWLLSERWIPVQLTARLQPVPRLAPVMLLVALLVAALVAVAIIGTQRQLPPPYGPAANGQLAYVSAGQIFAVEPDGSAARPLSKAGEIAGTPAWSPDGTRLAFKVVTNWSQAMADLVVIDADGSHRVVVDAKSVGLSPVTWSNDSQRLLYSKVDGKTEQIFIAAADGSGINRVGSIAAGAWGPVWSPDNQRIAFVMNEVGSPAIASLDVMNVDGSNPHAISHHHFDQYDAGEWSPDSTRFAYSSDATRVVYLAAADGSSERRISPANVSSLVPSWSPDGTSLAYLTNAGATGANLVIANSDGTPIRTVPGRFAIFEPRWSPDGTRIAVTDISGGFTAAPVVLLLDVSGSLAPIAVTTSNAAVPGLKGYDGHIDDTTWQRQAP